jgi:Amt family ammonium transporter
VEPSWLPLTFLIPVGLLLANWGSVPASRLRESALAALVATISSLVAYGGFGFAFQFGAVGHGPSAPAGLTGLDTGWSPFPGSGQWTFIGLEGFFLNAQGTPESLALLEPLALHRLSLAITAALIPVVALGDGANRVVTMAASIIASAIVFPITGAWVWGGGWLAWLGTTLNLGHGAIDVGGSGIAFLGPACVTLVALRMFRPLPKIPIDDVALPAWRRPLLITLGAALFGIGWCAWAVSDPLMSAYPAAEFGGVVTTSILCAAASMGAAIAYIWFVTGRFHLVMLVRGWLAGWIAAGTSAWFVPPGSAAAIGLISGFAAVLGQYGVEHGWRLDNRSHSAAAYGAAGAWGLIALGLFADGAFGVGWNAVMTSGGVQGLLASDPGQLSAQLAALIAIGLFAACVAAALLLPISFIVRRLPSAPDTPTAPEPGLNAAQPPDPNPAISGPAPTHNPSASSGQASNSKL